MIGKCSNALEGRVSFANLPNSCMSGLKHDRMQRDMLSALRFGGRSNGLIRSATAPHKRTLHFSPIQHLLRSLCIGHVASLQAFRQLCCRSVVTGTSAPNVALVTVTPPPAQSLMRRLCLAHADITLDFD